MPACMIIFKILFSQKHCTLYLYSNRHVRIPIYEFEICISVKKHANGTPTFGNGFGIQKRLQKAVQVSSILPWTSQGNNICFTELFVTILKRVVKWAKNNLLQHVPVFWSYSFWNGKRKQAHISKSYNLFTFTINPPQKDEMRWKQNLALNNDDGKKTVQKTIYIKKKMYRKLFT